MKHDDEEPCEHCGEVHVPDVILPNDENIHTCLSLWVTEPISEKQRLYQLTAFERAYDIAESQGMNSDDAFEFALSFTVVCGVSVSKALARRRKQAPKGPEKGLPN
jgi:hypothetical protein